MDCRQKTQILTEQQSLIKPLFLDTQGYKQIYICKKCGAKFRSEAQIQSHYAQRHRRLRRVAYEKALIDGNYIQSRLDICGDTEISIWRWNFEDQDIETKTIRNSCYVRFCDNCLGVRRGRYARKYKNAILKFDRVVVLTLTYRGHYPLNSKVKRDLELQLRNFVKRLERKLTIKIQYVRVLEMVEKPNGFYYHYHFLIDLPYIEQKVLSKMWHETTGNSFVVWIEALKDENNRPIGAIWKRMSDKQKQKNCVNYLTKYLAKPLSNIDLDQYARYVYASHFVETRLTRIKGHFSSIVSSEKYGKWHFLCLGRPPEIQSEVIYT